MPIKHPVQLVGILRPVEIQTDNYSTDPIEKHNPNTRDKEDRIRNRNDPTSERNEQDPWPDQLLRILDKNRIDCLPEWISFGDRWPRIKTSLIYGV